MRIKSILVGFVLAASLAAPAAAKTYHCKFTDQGKSGYVPQEVIIVHDETSGQVTVNDPIIQYFIGNPVPGVLKSLNTTRALFKWTVPKVKNSTGQYTPGFTYTVNVILASKQANITAQPQGYVNLFRGNGACTIK